MRLKEGRSISKVEFNESRQSTIKFSSFSKENFISNRESEEYFFDKALTKKDIHYPQGYLFKNISRNKNSYFLTFQELGRSSDDIYHGNILNVSINRELGINYHSHILRREFYGLYGSAFPAPSIRTAADKTYLFHNGIKNNILEFQSTRKFENGFAVTEYDSTKNRRSFYFKQDEKFIIIPSTNYVYNDKWLYFFGVYKNTHKVYKINLEGLN